MATAEATNEVAEQEQTEQQQGESRALATQQKAPIEMGARGITLSTFEELWRFSLCIVQGGFAPKGMESPQAVAIAVQMGMEVGLPPMAAIQNIAVINNRPGIWGDAVLGVCRASGLFDESVFAELVVIDEKSGLPSHATVTVGRKGGKPVTATFTWDDAKRAKLAGKAGPWSEYPQRMIKLRARSWALRDAFPDVLRGIPIAEELRDTPTDRDAIPTQAYEPAAATEDKPAPVSKSAQLAAQMGTATDVETTPKKKPAKKADKPADEPELNTFQQGYLHSLTKQAKTPGDIKMIRDGALGMKEAKGIEEWINAQADKRIREMASGQGELPMA